MTINSNYELAKAQTKTDAVELAKAKAFEALQELAKVMSLEYSDAIEANTKSTLLYRTITELTNKLA